MKKSIIAATLAVASIFTMGMATANAFPVDVNGYVGAETKYVFRGVEQSTNPSAIAGVSANAGYLTLSAEETTLTTTRQIESDLAADVTFPVTNYLNVSAGIVGYIYTGFNPKVNSTTDLYLGASTELYGFDFGVTSYRQSQSNDIWTDISASYDYAGYNLHVGTSYASWKNTLLKDQFEVVNYGISKDVTVSYFDLTVGFDATNPLNDKIIGSTKSKNLYNGYVKLNF